MHHNKLHTVLMTADTLGGVWTYASELTQTLQAFDIQVHLATFGRHLSDAQRQTIKNIPNLTIHESNFKLEWMEEPWEDIVKAGKWLQDIAHEVKPDMIHFNHYAHAAMPWKAPVVVVAHSCVYTWWQAVYQTAPPSEWNRYHSLVKKNLQAADHVVGISKAFLQQLHQVYGNFHNTSVIYNGISLQQHDFSEKQHVVFAMGRIWDEAKNLAILDQVAPRISWKIKVAGDTFHPVLACEQALECVAHLGLLDHPAALKQLAQASIFVLPAKYEPFGLAPLEAAANGCALVLADLPTLREIWKDAALYFSPNDVATLTQQINQLIENEALRVQFAQKAFQRAQHYNVDNMAAEYIKLYQKLIYKSKDAFHKQEMIQA